MSLKTCHTAHLNMCVCICRYIYKHSDKLQMYAFNGKNVKQIHKNVPEFLYKIQYKHINRGNLHVFTNIKTSTHTHAHSLWVNIVVFQILATNYKNNVKDYDVLQRNRFVY